VGIDGPEGLINRTIKAVLERLLEVELAAGSGNTRNSFSSKIVYGRADPHRRALGPGRPFRPQLPNRTRRLVRSTTTRSCHRQLVPLVTSEEERR
jgi:hypothetical protein